MIVHSSVSLDTVNMSYHPYRLQSIEDETRLLEKMLDLQGKVRSAREKERHLKSTQSSHYTKMFQPITNSLKQLSTIKPVVKVNTSTSTDENTVKNKLDEDKKYDKDEPYDDSDELDDETVNDDPGDLYMDALASIPQKSRDDGIFGLNVQTGRIGDYFFVVNGNTLYIMDDGEILKSYVIDDYDLWRLLMVKRPNDIGLKLKDIRGKNSQTLDEFIHIVQELDLVSLAKKDFVQIKNRAKYKLLPKVGQGFLFTSIKPDFSRKSVVNPNVVVVPSDKKGFLRELVKSVAELRSGNTSMQNVVVPLAQEAKRLKILPPGLLSAKEMTWVFA